MLEKPAMTGFSGAADNGFLKGFWRFLKPEEDFKFSAFSFYKSGFTLAEVLITLGVIGVVAAMTLPTVVNNARNKQLEAGLKRSYSLIAQALDRYQADTGERLTNENVPPLHLKSMIMKYFKIAQDCGMGYLDKNQEGNSSCLVINSNDSNKISNVYTNYYGKMSIVRRYFDDGQFVLDDGSLILINNDADKPTHLLISVDVNGYKKNPNRLGHDLFMFEIDDKGKLLPMGMPGTFQKAGYSCYANSQNSGWGGAPCTYQALIDKNYFKNLPR